MKFLVAGGTRVDAGKTTFSTGLLFRLQEDGSNAVGFKPRAGNDYWFDHDDYRAAVADGRLYGKDARKLAAASAGEFAPEAINPVHRLWRPTPGRSGLLGEPDRTFLVDRLTTEQGTRFVVNGAADLPDSTREALPLDDATEVSTLDSFNEVMASRYVPVFRDMRERVARTETAVVESYSDIALPLDGVEFDAVAVVDPGRVRVYDGDRFLKACEIASGSPQEGRLEERVESVVELLDPVDPIELPALSGAERDRPSAVADAYEDAFDEVLETASP